MGPIKTYTATIKVAFNALEDENPREIAKNIANAQNGTRGANLYTYGMLEKLVQETEE